MFNQSNVMKTHIFMFIYVYLLRTCLQQADVALVVASVFDLLFLVESNSWRGMV